MPFVKSPQRECHAELASFEDLARLACSSREYPKRVYSFELDGRRVAAITMHLTNTLAVMYAPLSKSGGYVSYKIDADKEACGVVDSISNSLSCAPIIHLKSRITQLRMAVEADDIPDVFHPIELADLGSLTRLTYDPDFPEASNLALYAVPINNSWVLGYLVYLEMDEPYYEFYYIRMDAEPEGHFVRYSANSASEPEFTDRIEHGYTYMPVIKLKEEHPIFGFDGRLSPA